MKIHETLVRDPRGSALANSGQARITAADDARALRELRAELETFVCDGQYGDAIERILQSYLTQMDRPRQNAAWISGFFGSGKSHLLKVLGHLWMDSPFEGGASARNLVHGLPADITALLRELDTQVARSGRPALAAAGTLPSGSGDHVRLTVLSVLNRACGLPEPFPQAQFCFWLREQGYLDRVRAAVEAGGKDWRRELPNLYVSGLLARAILDCDPDFGRDEREARQVLRQRFPNPSADISTADFLAAARQALACHPGDPDRGLPLTILLLDEAQQYVGDSHERAVGLTELAEAVQTQLESRVMLVMSGQSALSGTSLLQKMRDRFRITVQLSDTDVEAVTRKVLLRKKPSSEGRIQDVLETHAGEVSRHLRDSRIAERASDRAVIVQDYPLLPTRRRFWEECFRAVDAPGTHSQLRSQLRILHDALCQVAGNDLGAVVPADALFDALAPDLVNSGVLLGELASRITALDDGSETGRLRRRLSGLVFLITRLPREASVDVGLRANARTLADLLVEDLTRDSGALRSQVEGELEALAREGALMKVGEEYRLQTTQGAEWDGAFREKHAALKQKIPEMKAKQDQLLAAAVQKVLGGMRLLHGDTRVPRALVLHARDDAPPAEGDAVVVWLRDGSSAQQKEVVSEARRRGAEDPVLRVFLEAPDQILKSRMIEAEAARLVLDIKGSPTEPPEAREACESMKSRRHAAEVERDEAIRALVAAARVYQGGGTEVFGETLESKLETGCQASLARLFPRFVESDQRAWEVALRRARDGSERPLEALGWDGATEDHPVVRQVLAQVGAGARGTEVRKALRSSPFGWGQDAIDAALMTLHRIGLLRVTSNGAPLAPGQLDQAKIPSAEFRPEKVRLGAPDKLALRGLFQKLGIPVRSGEEEARAPAFLEALADLAHAAGGDPPLAACPAPGLLDELRKLSGTEQLARIVAKRQEIESFIQAWTALRERRDERLPRWRHLETLLEHAAELEDSREIRTEVEAIRRERSALADVDHVGPLGDRLGRLLRQALTGAREHCEEVHRRESGALEASEDWKSLDPEQRASIAAARRLDVPPALDLKDEDRLLASLARRGLQGWAELAESLPQRFAQARLDAAKVAAPAAQRVSLRSETLHTPDEVRQWLAGVEEDLLRRVAGGPIVIG